MLEIPQKTCNKCNETKNIHEFYVLSKYPNKRLGICKACRKKHKNPTDLDKIRKNSLDTYAIRFAKKR